MTRFDSVSDLSDQYRQIPTDKLLRRVAAARAAGDWTTARGEWEACIARAMQRVGYVVERYVAKGWIPPDEREDTVHDALMRGAKALVENLDSLSEDAFFAGMVQVAKYQCMDAGRKHMRREQHEQQLDERDESDSDGRKGRHDDAVREQATADWHRDVRAGEIQDVLARALAQLTERERKVVMSQRLGITDEELADEFETSTNNVQQIRSRALKKLRTNKELRGLIDP